MKILILNGPNLNLLGIREPEIYGKMTYAELCRMITAYCDGKNIRCNILQSNHEGELVDMIQAAPGSYDAIIINAAAYTHTSIAIADALRAVALPAAEVHLTDIDKREEYRRVSYLRGACVGCCYGKGFASYTEAIDFLFKYHSK